MTRNAISPITSVQLSAGLNSRQSKTSMTPRCMTMFRSECQVRAAAFVKIHDQKRDFADHVGPTERGIELQAVKNFDDTALHDHVPQVHVAMTFADVSVRVPR